MDNRTLTILLYSAENLCRVMGVNFPITITYAIVVSEPEKLKWAAQEWRGAAKGVNATAEDLRTRVRSLSDGWRGEAFDAFDDHVSRDATQLRGLAADMEDVAHTLDVLADKLQAMKDLLAQHVDRIIGIAGELIAAFLTRGAAGATSALTGAIGGMIGDILKATQEALTLYWKFARLVSSAGELQMPEIGKLSGPIAKAVPEGDWGPMSKDADDRDTMETGDDNKGNGGNVPSGGGPPGGGGPSSLAGSPPTMPMQMTQEGKDDPKPPGGFPGGGYTKEEWDPLPTGYGWVSPEAPVPAGWTVDPETHQLLPPGTEPTGQPPKGILPGYTWIAPGTELPAGWHVDPRTDVLVPPANLAADEPGVPADPDARQAWAFDRDDDTVQPGGPEPATAAGGTPGPGAPATPLEGTISFVREENDQGDAPPPGP